MQGRDSNSRWCLCRRVRRVARWSGRSLGRPCRSKLPETAELESTLYVCSDPRAFALVVLSTRKVFPLRSVWLVPSQPCFFVQSLLKYLLFPEASLISCSQPIPVSSSFWFLSLTKMNLLFCLFTVYVPPLPQPERKPQNLEALSIWVTAVSPALEQCLAWNEYPVVLAEWMNILAVQLGKQTKPLSSPGTPGLQTPHPHPLAAQEALPLFSLGVSSAGRLRVFWVWFL